MNSHVIHGKGTWQHSGESAGFSMHRPASVTYENKQNLYLYLTLHSEINSKLVVGPNVKSKIIKFLENNNIGQHFYDFFHR